MLLFFAGCSAVAPFSEELAKVQGPPVRPLVAGNEVPQATAENPTPANDWKPRDSIVAGLLCLSKKFEGLYASGVPQSIFTVGDIADNTHTVKYTEEGTGKFLASSLNRVVADAVKFAGVAYRNWLDLSLVRQQYEFAQRGLLRDSYAIVADEQGRKKAVHQGGRPVAQFEPVDYFFSGGIEMINFSGGAYIEAGVAASTAGYQQYRFDFYSTLELVRASDGAPVGFIPQIKEVVAEEVRAGFARFFGIWLPIVSAGYKRHESLVEVQRVVFYYGVYVLLSRGYSITGCDQLLDPHVVALLGPTDRVTIAPIRLDDGSPGPGSIQVSKRINKADAVVTTPAVATKSVPPDQNAVLVRYGAEIAALDLRVASLEHTRAPIVTSAEEAAATLAVRGARTIDIPVPFLEGKGDCCGAIQLKQVLIARVLVQGGLYEVTGATSFVCPKKASEGLRGRLLKGRLDVVVAALASDKIPSKPVVVLESGGGVDSLRNGRRLGTPAQHDALYQSAEWHDKGVTFIHLKRKEAVAKQ
ncbi:MAG: hypothetical protein Q8R39_01580 [bacterium]|nr:hypothetical protein [bacterium]MDZ4284541.1 hypothetical protein [Patescibacteria group bacterium]